MSDIKSHKMSCMEVWGGNREADAGVNTLGLDTWVYCRPHGDTTGGGGDVHYMSSCASGVITRVLLADVSGHGREVSRIAEGLRRIMQQNINRIDQRAVLKKVNDQFRLDSSDDRFATAIMFTYFAPSGSLTISNAGHPPPLLFSCDDQSWRTIDNTHAQEGVGLADMPLGIFKDMNYNLREIRLRRGDMILCYSDALIEAKKSDGKLLGVEGLLDHVKNIPIGSPSDMIGRLRESICSEMRLDDDDVTAIMIQRDTQRARVPVGRIVAAPARLLWSKLKNLNAGRAGTL